MDLKIAEDYQKEMGDLANRFTAYKNKYNTGNIESDGRYS